MPEPHHPPEHSAALMIGTRLVNMAIGLVTIPILIRYLGGDGFAAWAMLLALAAGFSLLEMGLGAPPAVVRFLAVPAHGQDWAQGRLLFGRVWLLLVLSFGCGWLLVLRFAAPLAAWLGLPDTPLFSAAETIAWVFGGVALRALLQGGTLALFAQRRFVAVSTVSLLQPLGSNLAAMLVAWQFRRLDLALIAFWSVQLAVQGVTFISARHMCLPRFGRATLDLSRLRELSYFGVASQMEGWAQFVNFQFDKFLVAGLVGLWGVAPYEVANRAVAALRSVPASGAETFLPAAVARPEGKESWDWYLASTRIAAYATCIFILAPLAIAPVFLYAWTGEMGHVGRWVFVALSVGAAASVLSLPAATLVQAAGRPDLQGRAALVSIVINVPLSLLLVLEWELVGAAIGSGVAMVAGSAYLAYAVHRHFGQSFKPTLRVLAHFWPPLLVCLCWGVMTYLVFSAWFEALDPAVRYSRVTRISPGLAALAIYAMCLGSLMAVEPFRGVFPSAVARWRLKRRV